MKYFGINMAKDVEDIRWELHILLRNKRSTETERDIGLMDWNTQYGYDANIPQTDLSTQCNPQ